MIHALLASFFTGVFGIFQKIEAEKVSLNRDSFIFYAYLFGALANIIIFLFLDIPLYFDAAAIIAWVLVTFVYIYVLKLRHNCLKYMTSSAYFINYRIFTSLLLVFIGTLFLWETITMNEYIWIALGFIIFYLLIEKKEPNETSVDLKKWYLYLAISIILATSIWIVQKYFSIDANSVWTFLFSSSIAGVFFSLWVSAKFDFKKTLKIPDTKTLLFLILVWLVFGPWYIFHLYAIFSGWDIAIIYKIISYSLFLPVIFSIVYYKESITPKKVIAFILTIISVGLFI